MKRFYLLVIFLAFAVLLQNSCPFGLAAKIGFVSPQMPNCLCAIKAADKTDGGENIGQIIHKFIGQSRTIVLPPSFRGETLPSYSAGFYRNISLNPPEKPPSLNGYLQV